MMCVFLREHFPLLPGKKYNTAVSDKTFVHRDDFHVRTHLHTHSPIEAFCETTSDWQAKRNRTFCGKHESNSCIGKYARRSRSGGTRCFASSFTK